MLLLKSQLKERNKILEIELNRAWWFPIVEIAAASCHQKNTLIEISRFLIFLLFNIFRIIINKYCFSVTKFFFLVRPVFVDAETYFNIAREREREKIKKFVYNQINFAEKERIILIANILYMFQNFQCFKKITSLFNILFE